MSEPITMEGLWSSYAREVLPADAPEVQRVECRRAFYAGAKAFEYALSEPPDELGGAVAQIAGLIDELEAFAGDVREGRS